MKKLKKISLVLIITLITICAVIPSNILASEPIKLASGLIDPDDYDPGNIEDAFNDTEQITNIAGTLVAVIRTIGIVVTVITLMLIGIKYMTGSLEEKADYKKSMIPYLIGVFIFFALSQIIAIIMELTSNLN